MAERDFPHDDLPGPQEIIALLKKNRRFILAGLGLLVVVVMAFGSYYQVEPEEEAVVLRFGAPLAENYGPGLHFKIPFVDDVRTVAVERQHRLEFGFRSDPGKESDVIERGYEGESLMLTGDLQLIHVRWSLIYKIDDIRIWLFEVKEQEETIRDISKAIMRQLVGDYSLHELLTVKLRELQELARDETQAALRDKVPTGVVVTELSIRNTDVPDKAREAFERFNRTEPSVKAELSQAKAELDQITGDAEREKKRAVGGAQQRYAEVVRNAEGEAGAFLSQWEEYRQAKAITRQWLYLQAMTKVFDNADRKLVIDGNDGGGALKLLPLDAFLGTRAADSPPAAPRAQGGAQ